MRIWSPWPAVWWALRPDSPVYRDARLAAARDAMVRAREYAEAFGGSIAGLIEAADAGLMTSPGEHGSGFRAMAAGGPAMFARVVRPRPSWTSSLPGKR